jgi:hypothetical protein
LLAEVASLVHCFDLAIVATDENNDIILDDRWSCGNTGEASGEDNQVEELHHEPK